MDGIPSGGIDYLNPSDIESISILKDAASTAIYGARGANAVPITTVDRAEAGALDLRQLRWQEPWKFMALLNAAEYATLMNESRAAAGLAALPADGSRVFGPGNQQQIHNVPHVQPQRPLHQRYRDLEHGHGASHFSQDGIIGERKADLSGPRFV